MSFVAWKEKGDAHLAEKMSDPEFKREYEALGLEFELLSSLLNIRF